VHDGRSPRKVQELAVNPCRVDAMGLSFQSAAPTDSSGLRKKKVTLQEGYVRLFGGASDNPSSAMGIEK